MCPDKLKAEHDKRMAACEQGFQLQSASTRATLELVKEQMRRDSEAALQELRDQHRSQMGGFEHQRGRLVLSLFPGGFNVGTTVHVQRSRRRPCPRRSGGSSRR